MGFKPITLDRTRNLRYGMKAVSMIEERIKKPIMSVDFDNLTMNELAVVVWAGLAWEDESLTPNKVMDIIDASQDTIKITEVLKTAAGALQDAFVEEIEVNEEVNEKNV